MSHAEFILSGSAMDDILKCASRITGPRPTLMSEREYANYLHRQFHVIVPYYAGKAWSFCAHGGPKDKVHLTVDYATYVPTDCATILRAANGRRYIVPHQVTVKGKMTLSVADSYMFIESTEMTPIEEYLCL